MWLLKLRTVFIRKGCFVQLWGIESSDCTSARNWGSCVRFDLQTPRDDADDDDDGGATPFVSNSAKMKDAALQAALPPQLSSQSSAVDITVEDIIPCLTPANVADLVLLSMVCLDGVTERLKVHACELLL